ncbi:MAG TPA: hypothetical protein DEA08_17755 [Planctomycetes bacterium]|nr:hypothetical protein [Planctomycetota bacterium]
MGAAGAKAGAAMAGAGAALGGAMANIAGGPAKISHEGPGFPFKDLIMGGLGVVKSNLIPSVLVNVGMILGSIVGGVAGLLLGLGVPGAGIVAMIGGLLALLGSLAGLVFAPNYVRGVMEYQASGTNLSIGTLLKFDKVVRHLICLIIGGIGGIPLGLMAFAFYIMLENDEVGPGDALKAALAYAKRNIVPMILLMVVLGVVMVIPMVIGGVLGVIPKVGGLLSGLVTAAVFAVIAPSIGVAHYLAYDLKRAEIKAVAAEDGIQI